MSNKRVRCISAESMKKLRKKLEDLTVERARVIIVLDTARKNGDLRENSDYDGARAEIELIDKSVVQLENEINTMRVIDFSDIVSKDYVDFGAKIKVIEVEYDNETDDFIEKKKVSSIIYKIVSDYDIDLYGKKNPNYTEISDTSVIAEALFDKKINDIAEFKLAIGTIKSFKILSINY